MEMKKIHETILADMKQIVTEAVESAIDLKWKKRK